MDYSSEGAWERDSDWANFDDNNYPIKILPHAPVSSANIFESDTKRVNSGHTLSFLNYGFYKMT